MGVRRADMLWLLLGILATAQAEYLFTMPRTMEGGGKSVFCLTLKDMTFADPAVMRLTIEVNDKNSNNSLEMYSEELPIEDHQCQDVAVSEELDAGNYRYMLRVVLTVDGDTIFEQEQNVKITKRQVFTLVQTDKKIYKPGQTVKFRAMTLDDKLIPSTKGFDHIFIMTPNGQRVMQWRNVSAPNGLVSLELPLSEDPVQGKWCVTVRGEASATQEFRVEEYVLPKFEVTVTPPTYLLVTTPTISGTVCAKYTYGKPVKGELKMEICFGSTPSYYYASTYAERPCSLVTYKIDGCLEFHVNSSDIKLGVKEDSLGRYQQWGNLKITANVTEEATGVELGTVKEGPGFSWNPLNIQLEDDSGNFFKPAFPYRARALVTNPDNTPAPGELLTIHAQDWRSNLEWRKEIYTDDNGIASFTVVGFPDNLDTISISATIGDEDWRWGSPSYYLYGGSFDRVSYFASYPSRASLYIKRWFSPSNSYLYIPDIEGTQECDSELEVPVYYSSPAETSYNFRIMVKAGSKIVYTEERGHVFDGSNPDDLSEGIQNIVSPSEIPTPPPPPSTTTAEPVAEDGYEGLEPVMEEVIVPVNVNPLGDSDGSPVPRKKREASANLITHFQLTIPVNKDMSPDAKVIVYYIREDMEVVSTFVEFKVKNCFKNQVQMNFSPVQVRPGQDMTMQLQASPNSFCAVGMIDKSVSLLAGDSHITPEMVFNRVRQYTRPYSWYSYWSDDERYCKELLGEEPVMVGEGPEVYIPYNWNYEAIGADAIRTFREAELMVFTDANLETRNCTKSRRYHYYYDLEYARGAPGRPVALAGQNPMQVKNVVDASLEETVEAATEPDIRSDFPESWLWDVHVVGPEGTVDVDVTAPDTITEWVGNTVCTNAETGVGISPVVGVTAFQPFFLSLTLPYSAVRGEVVPVLATVFNYLSECLSISLTLKKQLGFEFRTASSNTRSVCVCGGEAESMKFNIVPMIIGEIDIEATAVSISDQLVCGNAVVSTEAYGVSDGVQRQLLIEADGFPQDLTQSFYLCPKSGEAIIEDVEINLPENLVPDSERGTVSVIGDLMGPTLKNLKRLLRVPYGCGEQNMASLVPNIAVLDYLTNSGDIDTATDAEARSNMRIGYQRQLKYRHSDGSYSAFGEHYGNANGSLWLTAFVVKSFAQSRSYITIDEDDLTVSLEWMADQQQTDGCFPRVGKVFSSYMKGGLSGESNPAGLTAFVLAAMIEADPEGMVESIKLGFQCLDSQTLEELDTYTLAVMAYAYSQSFGNPRLRGELDKRARMDDTVGRYWSREEVTRDKTQYGWWYRAPSAEVEMTAYILMSFLTVGDAYTVVAETQDIVRWISKQRNAYGGFSSTQDTVVALQALSTYASYIRVDDYNVDILVKDGRQEHQFSVSTDNSLIYQTKSLSPGNKLIQVEMSGSGCALVQINLKYNVYREEQAGPAFGLKVGVYRSRSDINDCARRTLDICTSYLKSGGVSNMAILTVKMVSGWNPIRADLDKLVGGLEGVEKYEIDKNHVHLYFDQVGKQRSCVSFEVEQDIRMSTKPALVRIYDYYETDYSVSKSYSIKTTCGTKEELPFPGTEEYDNMTDDMMQRRIDPSKPRPRQPDPEPTPEPTCPTCMAYTEDDDILRKLKCSSKAVYKSVVNREGGSYPGKILSDIRPKRKKQIGNFIKYSIAEGCSCFFFENNELSTRVMLFATKAGYDTENFVLDDNYTIIRNTAGVERRIRKSKCGEKKRRAANP